MQYGESEEPKEVRFTTIPSYPRSFCGLCFLYMNADLQLSCSCYIAASVIAFLCHAYIAMDDGSPVLLSFNAFVHWPWPTTPHLTQLVTLLSIDLWSNPIHTLCRSPSRILTLKPSYDLMQPHDLDEGDFADLE